MVTHIIDLARREAYGIRKAASLLQNGQVVAFPTETVYGLGASALDEAAIHRIFEAKGRPKDNPLIVHIAQTEQLNELVRDVPKNAQTLMTLFWPGPLTIILPKKQGINPAVSAGLDTLAVRMPSHKAARKLLRACGLPVAAPSANRSGRPSPTDARTVLEDLGGRIPLILDGGECEVGLESTVVDLSGPVPVLLRPGFVTLDMLQKALGQVEVAGGVLGRFEGVAKSPGMKYTHYAPRADVYLVLGEGDARAQKICALYDEQARPCAVLCARENRPFYGDRRTYDYGSVHDLAAVAHDFFRILRNLDEDGIETVFMEAVPQSGLGLAIMNRALRSAGFRVIEA
ncbi:MAG: L-threonylcarbamoyladenylate synthase [Christensenellales bacterium]|jgi:L-threonylcarbamoyladenylate synthase